MRQLTRARARARSISRLGKRYVVVKICPPLVHANINETETRKEEKSAKEEWKRETAEKKKGGFSRSFVVVMRPFISAQTRCLGRMFSSYYAVVWNSTFLRK